MTDLEALECIVVDLTPIAKEHNKEEIEQVKKSLEVLEFLKKYISVDIEYNQYWLKIYNIGGIAISEEEYNKLKEWLENDK